MPKPPIFPTIDWKELYEKGEPYDVWIKTGESESNRAAMQTLKGKLEVPGTIQKELASLARPIHVLAIAEDWCPDVIRHVPVLMKLTEAGAPIDVRFIGREAAGEAFARHLTLGGEAIPKFIFLSDKFVECGSWGPMQGDCREFIARGKASGDMKGARMKVFQRYQSDPGCHEAFRELGHLAATAGCDAP